jgi:hypothetical protein
MMCKIGMSVDFISGDRRIERRYEYQMELRFSYTDKNGALQIGSGTTLDLTRTVIRFRTDDPPPRGAEMELRIGWPFLLQNVCPLELVVNGLIISASERGVLLRMTRHEFRTRGERSFGGVTAPTRIQSLFG